MFNLVQLDENCVLPGHMGGFDSYHHPYLYTQRFPDYESYLCQG